jgi:hypothetical protein
MHSSGMNLTPEIWYGIGAAVLVFGMIYGWFRYATRDKRRDRITESATSILYNTRTRDDASEPPAPDELARRREEHRPPSPR